MWNQVGPNGQALRNILSTKNLDPALISETLAALRNTMDHYAQTEARRPSRGGNPGLDELPVADFRLTWGISVPRRFPTRAEF